MTRDPLSPQWEDCKVCGGDHWTKDHPVYAEARSALLAELLAAVEALPSQRLMWVEPGASYVEARDKAEDVVSLGAILALLRETTP
jgi:hypothetical protein